MSGNNISYNYMTTHASSNGEINSWTCDIAQPINTF